LLKSDQISSCTSTVGNHFVGFLEGKLKRNELTEGQLLTDLGIKSWKDFSSDIRNDRRDLRLEYVCKAKVLYNYSVAPAFGEDSFNMNLVADAGTEYSSESFNKSLVKHIGDTVARWLSKHKQAKSTYAETRLNKSRQQLHNVLNGTSRMFADELITIAQDLGESLDQLRQAPLPKGHYLVQLDLQQQIINQQQEQIELLKKQLKKK
jgi:hypothetical protein